MVFYQEKKKIIFSSILFLAFLGFIFFLIYDYRFSKNLAPDQSVRNIINFESEYIYLKGYPTNNKEFINFLNVCESSRYTSLFQEKFLLTKEKTNPVICRLSKMSPEFKKYGYKENYYLLGFSNLHLINYLEKGRYIGISFDLNNLINNISIKKEEKYYICGVSSPHWLDKRFLDFFSDSYILKEKEDIVCKKIYFNKEEEKQNMIFAGFVPDVNKIIFDFFLLKEEELSQLEEKEPLTVLRNKYPFYHLEKIIESL